MGKKEKEISIKFKSMINPKLKKILHQKHTANEQSKKSIITLKEN